MRSGLTFTLPGAAAHTGRYRVIAGAFGALRLYVKPDMTPREQRRVIMAFQMISARRYITAKRMQKLRRLPNIAGEIRAGLARQFSVVA